MKSEEFEKHRFKIFWKLYHGHYWGKRHTPLESIPKGLPRHAYGDCLKVAEQLIKEGWLLKKKTQHGLDVSLNPRRAEEIKRILEA